MEEEDHRGESHSHRIVSRARTLSMVPHCPRRPLSPGGDQAVSFATCQSAFSSFPAARVGKKSLRMAPIYGVMLTSLGHAPQILTLETIISFKEMVSRLDPL